MKLEEQYIVVTSNEPWGDIWYSKQNYAFELSRKNRVIFINPPKKWNPSNLFSLKLKLKNETSNLQSLDYSNWIPTRWKFTNIINNYFVSKRLKKFLRKNGFKEFIFWGFDPIRLYNPKSLGAHIGIYHCVDYYYFQYYGEKQLCLNSDYLFATSQLFLDEFSAFDKPKNVVPHGISRDEFKLDDAIAKSIDIPYDNYALYIGVVDHRMDFAYYEEVLLKFPNLKFLFVGPVRETKNEAFDRIFKERKYDNAIIVGPKHFKELKYFIAKSLFCMSFMDMSYHANTVHHHKTLVYLAQGKPIFGFAFEEYKANSHIMYMDNDKQELMNLLENFIANGEDPNLINERIDYALKYTFENILENASELIKE